MMRFQTAIAGLLAPVLVVPVFLGQGSIATLQDALAGTLRALEVLKSLEQRLQAEPAATLGLVLSATEAPAGDEVQRDRRLEGLRNEVNLLQMELDAMLSPVLGADGAVQGALGTRLALEETEPGTAPAAGITTGLDDSMRALLSGARPLPRDNAPREEGTGASVSGAGEPAAESAYTADPLRHGITCYRAGRYAEAWTLLAPLEDASALYWQARTLERLERLDEAVKTMERAIAKGGAAPELRRAQTDLEFLRWKRDFVKSLPASGKDRPASGTDKPASGTEKDAPR
jgi:hypothetical protein